jgi:coenzyme PQQ precursor peptide PqqA
LRPTPACARAGSGHDGLREACVVLRGALVSMPAIKLRKLRMVWTTPTLVEICIGLEINGYLPAEF